jgi:hypothetical protein
LLNKTPGDRMVVRSSTTSELGRSTDDEMAPMPQRDDLAEAPPTLRRAA